MQYHLLLFISLYKVFYVQPSSSLSQSKSGFSLSSEIAPQSEHLPELSKEWPFAAFSSCLTNTASQVEQCFPSVRPDSVQVGALAASVTSV